MRRKTVTAHNDATMRTVADFGEFGTVTLDEPVSHGGTGQGPSPLQAVLGALCGCEAVTFHRTAAERTCTMSPWTSRRRSRSISGAGTRLLPAADPEASQVVAEVFGAEAISVRTGVAAASVKQNDNEVVVALASGEEITADRLLVATGRQPPSSSASSAAALPAMPGLKLVPDRQGQQAVGHLGEVRSGHIGGGEQAAVTALQAACLPGGQPGPLGAVTVPGMHRHQRHPLRWQPENIRRVMVDAGRWFPASYLRRRR